MRPRGTPLELENRRRKAIRLLNSGKPFRRVAAEVGASLSSVVRWSQVHRRHGMKALRSKMIPGRSPLLSARQKKKLINILFRGPLRLGYQTNRWTLGLVGEVIEKHFGVRYSISNLWKLMYYLGWSFDIPGKRIRKRDEQTIRHLNSIKKDWILSLGTPPGRNG